MERDRIGQAGIISFNLFKWFWAERIAPYEGMHLRDLNLGAELGKFLHGKRLAMHMIIIKNEKKYTQKKKEKKKWTGAIGVVKKKEAKPPRVKVNSVYSEESGTCTLASTFKLI